MRIISLLILSIILGSCSNESTKSTTSAKKLDTSFLKLGTVGTNIASTDIMDSSHIHVLDEGQEIEIIDNEGSIKISNFDYTKLEDQDVIIGNKNDKYLFKVIKDTNQVQTNIDQISVTQGKITDITREEKASIKIEVTPEVSLKASESRSFSEVSPQKNTANLASSEKVRNDVNSLKLNILNFKDYEVININSQTQILGNGLKSGKKTTFNLQSGNDIKVTINKGFLELIPTFRGEFNFTSLDEYNLNSTFDALVRYEFEVTVDTKGKTVGEIAFPLFKEISIPVRVPGPVPVYIDVNLEFPAGIKIGTSKGGKLTYIVKSEYALTAQTYYDSKTGKQVTSHYDFIINNRDIKQVENQNAYLFELFFEPRMKTEFYKVLGPYAFINTNIQADIKIPLRSNEKDIFVNFSGGVGITLDEPIFGNTILDLQTPSLFNLSKGWDIIGPKPQEKSTQELELNPKIDLQVDNLDKRNRIALNLRPSNLSLLGKVRIFKRPSFGKLVLSENFENSGLAYYYPPKVIEGKDSFQIQVIEKGLASKPGRILLHLSQHAKKQANNKPLNILPDYSKQQHNFDNEQITSLPPGVMSYTETFPGSGNGSGSGSGSGSGKDGKCPKGAACIPEPLQQNPNLAKSQKIKLAPILIESTEECSEEAYKMYLIMNINKDSEVSFNGYLTDTENNPIKDNKTLEQILDLSTKLLTNEIYISAYSFYQNEIFSLGYNSYSHNFNIYKTLTKAIEASNDEYIKYKFKFMQNSYKLVPRPYLITEIDNDFLLLQELKEKNRHDNMEEHDYKEQISLSKTKDQVLEIKSNIEHYSIKNKEFQRLKEHCNN